jgi:putative Mg2+ transporter-C (MgtC) family protein
MFNGTQLPGLQAILNSLQAIDLTPLVFAVILGGAVGLEREMHGRPAGLRTHILVCLCSTMIITASRLLHESGFQDLGAGRVVFDPNRMGAGIVTGIGFLGAATVIRSGDLLRGLTTAACIWYVAGLGIVIGNGSYGLAIAGTTIVVLVLTVLNQFDRLLTPIIYRKLVVNAQASELQPLVAEVRKILKSERLRLLDLATRLETTSGEAEVIFFTAMKKKHQAPVVVEKVAALEGVSTVRLGQI